MEFLHDGRPPVVREATYAAGRRGGRSTVAGKNRRYDDDLTADPRLAQRLQQGMGDPPVRSRSAGGQRDQAAGRRGQRRPVAMRPWCGPSAVAARHRRRLRHEPALRRFRSLLDGGLGDRRGGAQLRGRRGRSRRGSPSSTISAGATPIGPKRSGRLVRAALACHDVAVALGTPFISGKDSLNNEFSYVDAAGRRQTVAIPPSLLISALGQIDDVCHWRSRWTPRRPAT